MQTWEYKVFKGFYPNCSASRIYQEDVRGLESVLATGGPQPKLAVILPLLVRWTMALARGLLHDDIGHSRGEGRWACRGRKGEVFGW